SGTDPRPRGGPAIPAAGWGTRARNQEKGAIVTAGTASRTAHLLAVMTNGDDLRPGPPGHGRGSVTRTGTRGALAAAVALGGWRRGSRNLRDASSPRPATRSGRAHSATEQISQGG